MVSNYLYIISFLDPQQYPQYRNEGLGTRLICILLCTMNWELLLYIHSVFVSLPVNVVGIAIGASIAAFVLFVVVPIIICVVIGCCVANHRPTRTTYVATAAPITTATVVSATSTQQHYTPYYPAPGTYPAKPNAPPPYPTGYEPPPTYPA